MTAPLTPDDVLALAGHHKTLPIDRTTDSAWLERALSALGYKRVVCDRVIKYVLRTWEEALQLRLMQLL